MNNVISPIGAGEIRRRGYLNPFDTHIGIKRFDSTGEGIKSIADTSEVTSNIHGTVHGGWSSANLDATSVGAVYNDREKGLKDDEYGVTALLDVKFKNPAFLGETYDCDAKVVSREGNDIKTFAVIRNSNGVEIASARGLIKARKLDYDPIIAA